MSAARGLVLPGLTSIATMLTPLAAIALVVVILLAAFTVHQPRDEPQMLAANLPLAALAVVVAVGRFVEPL